MLIKNPMMMMMMRAAYYLKERNICTEQLITRKKEIYVQNSFLPERKKEMCVQSSLLPERKKYMYRVAICTETEM